ncbi:MAG TPA: nitroreductase [Longimicrobiales bacterium]|nr:nitroreductase [Longimicrobiales bacterium]
MDVLEAIQSRRSVKRFTERPVAREEIDRILEAGVLAPNHRMTQPWRFFVLGPRARRAYGEVLAERKARKVEDPAAAEAVRRKVVEEHAALPAMVGVAVKLDANPEVREEDYAAAFMAIQNMALTALELGLGTHLKTGAVMEDPRARDALGVLDDERLVAILNIGEPAETAATKPRTPAAELTRWLP